MGFSTSPNLLLLQSGFSDVDIGFQVLQYASPSTVLFELVSDPNEDDTLLLLRKIRILWILYLWLIGILMGVWI